MAGRCRRINLATGEVKIYNESPEVTALKERVAELEAALKLAQWNEKHWKQQAEAYKEGGRLQGQYERQRLARVWKLVDRKRKTVRMVDLLAAFDAD